MNEAQGIIKVIEDEMEKVPSEKLENIEMQLRCNSGQSPESLTCNVHGAVPYSHGYCPWCEGGNGK